MRDERAVGNDIGRSEVDSSKWMSEDFRNAGEFRKRVLLANGPSQPAVDILNRNELPLKSEEDGKRDGSAKDGVHSKR